MRVSYLYWIVIIILISTLFFRECTRQSEIDSLVSSIVNYKDTVKIEKLKNGALVYSNQMLVLNSQEQIKALASSMNDTIKLMLKKFKSVTNVTTINNQFFTSGDTAKFAQNIPCDFKPFKVRRGSDSTFKLVSTISKDYFTIDTLSLKDKQSIVFGRKKVGFMKYDYTAEINHSNPMISTYGIKSYQYVPQKQWYEKAWVHILFGAVAETAVRQGVNYYIKTR